MSPLLNLTSDISSLLVAVTLVGLFVRGRASQSWTFVAYLLAVLVWNQLFRFWPERFWTQPNWMLMNATYAGLRVVLALELAALTFRALPRVLTMALLVQVLLLLLAWPRLPIGNVDVEFVGTVAPRLHLMGLWMLATVPMFAARYRVPISPLHRDILIGFGLYLAVFSSLLAAFSLVASSRPYVLQAWAFFNAVDPLAYIASVGVWTWASWRPDPAPRAITSRLNPWPISR